MAVRTPAPSPVSLSQEQAPRWFSRPDKVCASRRIYIHHNQSNQFICSYSLSTHVDWLLIELDFSRQVNITQVNNQPFNSTISVNVQLVMGWLHHRNCCLVYKYASSNNQVNNRLSSNPLLWHANLNVHVDRWFELLISEQLDQFNGIQIQTIRVAIDWKELHLLRIQVWSVNKSIANFDDGCGNGESMNGQRLNDLLYWNGHHRCWRRIPLRTLPSLNEDRKGHPHPEQPSSCVPPSSSFPLPSTRHKWKQMKTNENKWKQDDKWRKVKNQSENNSRLKT